LLFHQQVVDDEIEVTIVGIAVSINPVMQAEAVVPGAFEHLVSLFDDLREFRIGGFAG